MTDFYCHAFFNEAGAVMPRKGSRWQSMLATGSRFFNEAGAVMPRKGLDDDTACEFAGLSSMRPGQ